MNVLIRLRINWKVETTLPKIIKIPQENLIQEWSIGILIIDFGWDVKHLQVSPLTLAVCH